ncbi:MAG: hypothetical protein ACTSYR_05220 [Candidatus Odinarchaeia archaeon]
MEKYINITIDNYNDYLFKDIECEFATWEDFSGETWKGKLNGIMTSSVADFLLYFFKGGRGFEFCRTKNPDYKEPGKNGDVTQNRQVDNAGLN